METRYTQQIENALNRDQTNLIDAINLYKYEKFLWRKNKKENLKSFF